MSTEELHVVHVEAYLGTEKPDTLAEGAFAVFAEPQYAAVVQNRETGEAQIWDVYGSEAETAEAVAALTNSVQFGILCLVRASRVADADVVGVSWGQDAAELLEVAE